MVTCTCDCCPNDCSSAARTNFVASGPAMLQSVALSRVGVLLALERGAALALAPRDAELEVRGLTGENVNSRRISAGATGRGASAGNASAGARVDAVEAAARPRSRRTALVAAPQLERAQRREPVLRLVAARERIQHRPSCALTCARETRCAAVPARSSVTDRVSVCQLSPDWHGGGLPVRRLGVVDQAVAHLRGREEGRAAPGDGPHGLAVAGERRPERLRRHVRGQPQRDRLGLPGAERAPEPRRAVARRGGDELVRAGRERRLPRPGCWRRGRRPARTSPGRCRRSATRAPRGGRRRSARSRASGPRRAPSRRT